MHTTRVILLLVSIVVGMVHGDHISDNLKIEALKEHLYLFDVTSNAPSADVKGALTSSSAVTVRHSFKVIGQPRYMFVVESSNDDVDALRSLDFPLESEVTQYPIEHTSELMAMFGVLDAWQEIDNEDNLPADSVLLVHDWQFIQPETQCLSRYENEMANWARKYEATHKLVKPVSYAVIARYPPRIFIFNKFEENAMQNVVEMGVTQVGGPGRSILTTTRIVKF